MKVLGKNVVIATKKMCMEYTSKIQAGINDCVVGSNYYHGEDIEKGVIFVKDKNGYFVELEDLKSFPTLSLICYGAAPRWTTFPNRAGDKYIDEIKPFFSEYDQESMFDVKLLIQEAENFNNTYQENSISIN